MVGEGMLSVNGPASHRILSSLHSQKSNAEVEGVVQRMAVRLTRSTVKLMDS